MTYTVAYVLLGIAWWAYGTAGFLAWWSSEWGWDSAKQRLPLALFVGVIGPVAWVMGYFIHGRRR